MTIVRAPASSANLGPGFDVLGLALDRYAFASDEGDASGSAEHCWDNHIARIAFEAAGGKGDVWFRFEFPPARGMGFSAAARAAGAGLAYAQQGAETDELQNETYRIVAELEGHADNAAPAVFGGIHVVTSEGCHRLAAQLPGELLVWVPHEASTSTDENRATLTPTVAREDAVFNLGRLGLLLAALYEQNIDLLHQATGDRLHQAGRFALQPLSARAYEAAIGAGAAAAWLSGSGPSVGIVAHPGRAHVIETALPDAGDLLHVATDLAGTIEVL